MRTILYYQGLFLAILAMFMLAPLSFAISEGHVQSFRAFLITLLIYVSIAGAIIFALRGNKYSLERNQQVILLALVWILIPFAAAFPIVLSLNIPFTDAFFEAVSGYTTTGATILPDVGSLPKSIILWRSLLNWLGGLTTYMAVVILLRPLFGNEIFGREIASGSMKPQARAGSDIEAALITILPVYLGVTISCFILLGLSGIDKFDALCLTYSAVSTGGFMPHSGNLQIYGRPAVELTLTLFMFIGAVSILWVQSLVQFRWSFAVRMKEPFFIAGMILVLGLFIAISVYTRGLGPDSISISHALTIGIATATSLVSTTGIPISTFTDGAIPYVLLLTLVMIGGGRFSTAGGLKFYRIGEMLKLSLQETNRLIYPHGVNESDNRYRHKNRMMVQSVWTHFSVIVLLTCMIAIALSATGIPLESAFLASASALSNFGPAYLFADFATTDVIPGYADMSINAKLVLCLAMIVGRMEVLAFLALFNIAVWRR